MTYHLFKDFGVYKQSIKNNYYSGDLQYEYPEVGKLLDRRTQRYTIEELEVLFGFLWTSHDDCVLANSEDYTPLQIYTAKNKVEFGQSAWEKLKAFKTEPTHGN